MRSKLLVALLGSALAWPCVAGESRPLSTEERELLIYLQSVGAPVMQEICEPLYRRMPETNARISAWVEQNGGAIERARALQATRLKDGDSIENYEDGVRRNLRSMLAAAPMEKMARQCLAFSMMAAPATPQAEQAAPDATAPQATPGPTSPATPGEAAEGG